VSPLSDKQLVTSGERRMKARSLLTLVSILFVIVLGGCASTPTLQWWRVGTCLVLYEPAGHDRQIIVAGQGCDVKKDALGGHGEMAGSRTMLGVPAAVEKR
jgi:hypothetical protein